MGAESSWVLFGLNVTILFLLRPYFLDLPNVLLSNSISTNLLQRTFFLQHVFHDDLIPLFFTMKYLCYGDARECLKKYQVSDFKNSYSKLSRKQLLSFMPLTVHI